MKETQNKWLLIAQRLPQVLLVVTLAWEIGNEEQVSSYLWMLSPMIKKNKIFSLSNQMFTSSKRSFLLSISFAFQSLENLIMAFDACYNMDEP